MQKPRTVIQKGDLKMQSMKLLIFSDSHGDERAMRQAIAFHPDAEVILFLGDGLAGASAIPEVSGGRAMIAVRGNCDSCFGLFSTLSSAREEEVIVLCGRRILLVHGHREGVKSGLGGIVSKARRLSADIALFGHTHEKYSEYRSDGEKPLYLFNPGSISRPASGKPSYGVLLLTESGVLLSHGEI